MEKDCQANLNYAKKMMDELPEANDIILSDVEQVASVMGKTIMNQSS